MTTYSFVTVVFDKEIPLLLLQAKSFELFIDKNIIHKIYIIYNSKTNIPSETKRMIYKAYDSLKDRVEILMSDSIVSIERASGWDRQQVLKLCVSRIIKTDNYIVLDAKTHLVHKLDEEFLSDHNGRAQANIHNYEKNALRYAFDRVYRFFGRTPCKLEDFEMLDSVPPFIFYTDVVIEMIKNLEEMSKMRFSRLFLREGFTEFLLYSGWIKFSEVGLDKYYNFHQVFYPIIWGDTTDINLIQDALNASYGRKLPFLSIHRRAYSSMSLEAFSIISKFWIERELFRNEKEASDFREDLVRLVSKITLVEKFRALLLRPIYFSRRIKVRLFGRSGHRSKSWRIQGGRPPRAPSE